MTLHPLIRHSRLEAPLAYRDGRPISAAEFLGDAAALAALLPPHRHVINLCRDRYRFTVGLAAALMREQISLLPPNDLPAVIEQLAVDFGDLYCLSDGAATPPAIALLTYPDPLARRSAPVAVPAFPDGQPAIVLFTSGSTGRPKPQRRSWGALARSAVAAGDRLGVAALGAAAIVGTVPHQHSYGIESTVMLGLQHGLALQAERPFYPGDVATCLAALPRPRILVTTPIHIRALLAEGELPPLDLLISATAPLSAQLAAEAEARFAAPLSEIYGCSEAGQLATRRTSRSMEWSALENVRLRQDERGTWASGGPVETETLLNDVIELIAPARFLLHGRTADLVNIAGKRTSLAHLNHHLTAIEGVLDGVFVMPQDEADGVARLMAYVVAPGISAETIMAALRQRIDGAFLPRPLVLVDALPRNPLGKLTQDALGLLAPQQGLR